jgi:hypothetical protein
MKTLFFALMILGTVISKAQAKTEKVYVKDIDCTYDTTATYYEDGKVRIDDSSKIITVSAEGKNKILMIHVYSKECECLDCGESFQFAIKTDSLKLNQPLFLNSSNLTWVYSNSWIPAKLITSYLGTITQTDKNSYLLKLSELLGTSVIRNIQVTVKTN